MLANFFYQDSAILQAVINIPCDKNSNKFKNKQMKRHTQKETIKSNDGFIFPEEKNDNKYIKSLKPTIPILTLSIRIYLSFFINRPNLHLT